MAILDLFRPKWKHSNWKVREAAIEKLTDQNVLIDIAKNDEDYNVRTAAIEKITDQNVIIDVAKTDKNDKVRTAARNKISDEQIALKLYLIDIVKETNYKPSFPKIVDYKDTSFRSKGGTSSSPL